MVVNEWETQTSNIIATLSTLTSKAKKKPQRKKYIKKKRVGCREAKRLEQMDNVGEVLTADECTMFRALSARAMYLAMDRPDIMFSSKELCRKFANPTGASVAKLKRLVRYVHRHPRLVRRFDFEPDVQKCNVLITHT